MEEYGAKNGATFQYVVGDAKLVMKLRRARRRLILHRRRSHRTRATGVIAPPAPPILLLSHGEEFEEKMRGAPQAAAARIDLYTELLCLEAVVFVEYSDVYVEWVQQQQQQQQLQPRYAAHSRLPPTSGVSRNAFVVSYSNQHLIILDRKFLILR